MKAPFGPAPERLVSLDAFRGAIMLLMASGGLGIPQIVTKFPDNPLWQFWGYECEHAPWAGCTLWDVIQPAFMFMVGVALPWSIAGRQGRGMTAAQMFGHALWRAVLLVLLAVFLSSNWDKQTDWVFTNVLAQIGLGYPFLFLLAFAQPRVQWLAVLTILVIYWAAFATASLPPSDFDWNVVGVPADWPHLANFASHWEKNANFASRFDVWFLNLFPRAAPFVYSSGGYATPNFIPSLVTMIFGLLAGELLKSDLALTSKLTRLVLAGVSGMILGAAIDAAGLCPIVKRIWTPSWTIFSGGLVTLLLAAFVAIIDGAGRKRWAFPLIVAGLNPITLYCLWQLAGGFIRQSFKIHFGQHIFESCGPVYVPALERGSVLLVLWLVTLWMYRNRIFVRI